jgi:hypothetical protein
VAAASTTIRRLFAGLVGLVDGLPAIAGLTAISVLCGVLMLWVLGKTTPQRRLERARDRMVSAVYEVRLFLDSPARVWRAQARLVGSSLVYIGYLLPAFVLLLPPLALLYPQMDLRYGVARLAIGEPALVRVELADGVAPESVSVAAPVGFRVTAPPLFIVADGTLSLRLGGAPPGARELALGGGHGLGAKRLSADPASAAVSVERARGPADLLAFGNEPALDADDGVERIVVTHATAAQTWLGLAMPWWLYWLIVSMVTALALRKPMGIVF